MCGAAVLIGCECQLPGTSADLAFALGVAAQFFAATQRSTGATAVTELHAKGSSRLQSLCAPTCQTLSTTIPDCCPSGRQSLIAFPHLHVIGSAAYGHAQQCLGIGSVKSFTRIEKWSAQQEKRSE